MTELGITWAQGEDSQAMNRLGLPAIHATAGETFRNELEDFTVTGSLWRFMARQAYPLRGDVQWMDADLATKRFGIPGALEFDEAVPEPTARQLWETKKRELAIDALRKRSDSPVAQIGGALVAQILDPLNVGAAFVPVVREARYAELLAAAGGALGRTGLRAATGAASGVVGTAPLELLHVPLAAMENRHYTADEAMLNIVFGGVFGGGLHVVGGSFADLFRAGRKSMSGFQSRMASMPPDQKGQVLQTGIADLLDGGYVRNAHLAIDGGEPQPWRPHPADAQSEALQLARVAQGEISPAPVRPTIPQTPPRTTGEPIGSFRTVDGRLYDVDELGGATAWRVGDDGAPIGTAGGRTLYVPPAIATRLEQAPLSADRQRAFTVSIRGDEARLIELEGGPRGGWNVVGTHSASARPSIGLRPLSLDTPLKEQTIGKRLTALWGDLRFGERIGEINPTDRQLAAGVQAPSRAAPIAGAIEGAADQGVVQRLRVLVGDRRQALTVDALATRLEASPAATRLALGHLAARGELGMRTGRDGSAVFSRPPQRGPLDVLEFIAARGGLRDNGGELAAMDAQRMTSHGPLVRAAGADADRMGEALAEAGYIKDGWTERDVWDVVDRAIRGERVFSEADAAELLAREASRSERDANRAYLAADKEIRALHDELGGDLSRSELAHLARYATDRELDLEDVLSHALERKAMAMLDSDRQAFALPDDIDALYRGGDALEEPRGAIDTPDTAGHDFFPISEVALGPDANLTLAVTRARPPGAGDTPASARDGSAAATGRQERPAQDGGRDGSPRGAAPGEGNAGLSPGSVSEGLKDIAAALELAERDHASLAASGRILPADAAAIADADSLIATARLHAIAREAAVFCPGG